MKHLLFFFILLPFFCKGQYNVSNSISTVASFEGSLLENPNMFFGIDYDFQAHKLFKVNNEFGFHVSAGLGYFQSKEIEPVLFQTFITRSSTISLGAGLNTGSMPFNWSGGINMKYYWGFSELSPSVYANMLLFEVFGVGVSLEIEGGFVNNKHWGSLGLFLNADLNEIKPKFKK